MNATRVSERDNYDVCLTEELASIKQKTVTPYMTGLRSWPH